MRFPRTERHPRRAYAALQDIPQNLALLADFDGALMNPTLALPPTEPPSPLLGQCRANSAE
ncbi:MAG: hypothetical protein DMF25_06420 [Verrucomicrobia bacterium]|nr:MAG: hypothetical protein DMF25_06420 [Verrucomicrobiota bacterium]